ncbi:MAG: thrombospondin type 3 repeat-containing protein [Myxococcota bacterium]|nr:thrombospondin type 3 repeat-containing protein [Myxococcota bacterium]
MSTFWLACSIGLVTGCSPDDIAARSAHDSDNHAESMRAFASPSQVDVPRTRVAPRLANQVEQSLNADASDRDDDGVSDLDDNCPNRANWRQLDGDRDGLGDVCDERPTVKTFTMSGQSISAGASIQRMPGEWRSSNGRFVLDAVLR